MTVMDTHRAVEQNSGADFDKLFEEFTEGGDYQASVSSVDKEENTAPEQQSQPGDINHERLHIVIYEDTILNETKKRKLALRRNFRTNLYKLRRRINLVSDERWVGWLQSQNFKPVWLQLWYQWLAYHRTEMIEPLRRQAFWLCTKKYQLYLSQDFLLRTNHGGVHHLARFLAWAVLKNFGHGALSRLVVAPEPLHLMWAVMLVMKLAHAPKHIHMLRGGAALLTRPYEQLVKAR